KITLVIGAGVQAEQVPVPDLVGLTFGEAKQVLQEKGISLAAVVPLPGVKDTLNAFIYKQDPETRDIDDRPLYIQPGRTMDIWLSPTPPNPDSLKEEEKPDLQQ